MIRPALAAGACALAVAGCTGATLDYVAEVQTALNRVTDAYQVAERACAWNYQDADCAPAVREYRTINLEARRAVHKLDPPDGARRAHRTVLHATRVALDGTRLALSGIRDQNPNRWWAGVQTNKEAAGYVSLAWSQLR